MHSKTVHVFALFLVVTVTLISCAPVRRVATRLGAATGCRLVMVYGGGPSVPTEDERAGDEQLMSVYVELSDSTYEFGHLSAGGQFERDISGLEGRFVIRGGEERDFAIRELGGHRALAIDDVGSCDFVGPAMRPSRAIFPVLEEPYHSIAVLNFFVTRSDTVFAQLTASSPNGFARAR